MNMGAWGELAFDNDEANDWAYGLEDVDDLSLVESALGEIEELGDEYVDQETGCNALAACEVLARLQGHPGYNNAYTKKVDDWVAAHPFKPSAALLTRAAAALDRVLGEDSELPEVWAEGDANAWRTAVADLRRRLSA
ncbi:MAG: DUF4259 domain-containing protein [Acidobacteriota bacterium]